ncbi:MAG: hypothetical protein F6K00_14555 [Leptolyngbya sp. SIOISBB]|nr:hypothetical protein [Leptolyngbya sp. SIOISBB]
MQMKLFRKLAIILGLACSSLVVANRANAEFTIAYCDAENTAANVFRDGDPESPNSELKIRLYDRGDEVVFLTSPAIREPNPEGYNYSNEFGNNQWTLFIPNSGSSCTLSRDGEVYDMGEATIREPSSTGGV